MKRISKVLILGIILLFSFPVSLGSEPIDLLRGEKIKVESLTQAANNLAYANGVFDVEIWVEHPIKSWPSAHYYFTPPNRITFTTQMLRKITHPDEFMYLVALMLVNIQEPTRNNAIMEKVLDGFDLDQWLLDDIYLAMIAVDYIEYIGCNPIAALSISSKLSNELPSNVLLYRIIVMKTYFKLTGRDYKSPFFENRSKKFLDRV